MKRLILAAILCCPAFAALAQTSSNGGQSYTLGTTAAYLQGAATGNGPRTLVVIDNPSATINVGCAFGQTAVLNTGGTFMIPAGSVRIWPAVAGAPVPAGALSCIAASGAPTITVDVH